MDSLLTRESIRSEMFDTCEVSNLASDWLPVGRSWLFITFSDRYARLGGAGFWFVQWGDNESVDEHPDRDAEDDRDARSRSVEQRWQRHQGHAYGKPFWSLIGLATQIYIV